MKTSSHPIIEALEARIAPAAVFSWKGGNGNWNDASKWTLVSGSSVLNYPNAVGDEARFTSVDAVDHTVTIPNINVTVGKLTFNDDDNTSIVATGAGSLNIDDLTTGAKISSAGTGQLLISAPVNLKDDTSISSNGTATLVLSGKLSSANGSDAIFDGTETVRLSGSTANAIGTVQVKSGTLQLDKTSGLEAVDGISIGDGVGSTGDAVVQLLESNQITSLGSIYVYADGQLDLNGNDETLAGLVVYSGTTAGTVITTGAGTLTLAGGLTHQSSGTGAVGASIAGRLAFTTATGNISVQDGAASSDLTISAVLKGPGGMAKYNTGTLEIATTAAQEYAGLTTVDAGVLLLKSSTSDKGLSASIQLNEGATLQLGSSYELPDNTVMLLEAGATLEVLPGVQEDLTDLNFVGSAEVKIGAGSNLGLEANGLINVEATANGGAKFTGEGSLRLEGAGVTFQVAETLAATDLLLGVTVTDGGSTWGLSKTGPGALWMAKAGTYQGTTTLANGTLQVDGEVQGPLSLQKGLLIGGGSFTGLSSDMDGGGTLATANNFTFGNFALNAGHTFAPQIYQTLPTALKVNGTVSLANASLSPSTLRLSSGGAEFVILQNDGADAVSGTFAGLPEGAVVTTATGNYTISYVGGTGNDVTLKPILVEATIAANGKSATYTDRDGDLVTVKITKGTLTQSNFTLVGAGLGAQLVDFSLLGGQGYDGAAVVFSAKPQGGLGDRHVDVGTFYALSTDIASIVIPGDLGSIIAGNGSANAKLGVGSLTVDSFGATGDANISSPAPASFIEGPVNSLKIKNDLRGGSLSVNGALAKLSIGGSILPDASGQGGYLYVSGYLGSATIAGDLVGTADSGSGYLKVVGSAGSIKVGGSLLGGDAFYSGCIEVSGDVGSLSVARSLVGGEGEGSGAVQVDGKVLKATVGALLGGAGPGSGSLTVGSMLKSATVLGDLDGGAGPRSGSIVAPELSSLQVKGSILGGAGGDTGLYATKLGTINIARDLRGEAGSQVVISAKGVTTPADAKAALAIASITVGGSVQFADILAGYEDGNTGNPVNADVQIGKLSVKGDWTAGRVLAGVLSGNGRFGDADDATVNNGSDANLASRIASITIGGRVQGTYAGGDAYGFVAEQIGALKVNGTTYPINSTTAWIDAIALGSTGDTFARKVGMV